MFTMYKKRSEKYRRWRKSSFEIRMFQISAYYRVFLPSGQVLSATNNFNSARWIYWTIGLYTVSTSLPASLVSGVMDLFVFYCSLLSFLQMFCHPAFCCAQKPPTKLISQLHCCITFNLFEAYSNFTSFSNPVPFHPD